MKAVWEALKGMATWLWKNGPGIFKGIYDGLQWLVPKIGKLIGGIFKWLFGESDKDRAQDKVDDMKKKDGETETAFKNRKDAEQKKVDQMLDGGERTGGLDDSLFKQVAFYLGGLILLLKKLGPDGIVGKMFSKMGKTLFDKVIRNKVMEDKVKGYLTDDMMKMDRGKKLSMMDKFRNNDYVKYGKDKASKVGGAVKAGASKVGGVVKAGASKVGGAVKSMASTGGDWFKTLMGKFGKAGKFLAKMGKSVIQGLMTMGPYGWAILGGIALGGLVWYFWDDVTRVWDNIAGTISKGFTKVKEMVTGMFGNVQGMLGGWLRGIGAGMIADWIDPDGAEEGEEKKEFTFGGFMGELWAIYSGIWKKIFDLIKSIDPVEIVKSLAGGLVNLAKDALPFMKSDEEKQKDADAQAAIKAKNDAETKAKNDAIAKKAAKGESTWYAPTTWFSSDDGKEKEKQKFFKEIKKDIKGAKRWRGKNREKKVEPINKKINDSPYRDEVLGMLSTSQLKLIGRDGLATKKHEENKLRLAARTPEQVAADDKYFKDHSGSSASDDFAGAPLPMVSPTMKADTLNQVQGENAELSSGTNAIVAPTTINNITNNYGSGGEGGTAIYGVPTAQKGTKVKHSNIR